MLLSFEIKTAQTEDQHGNVITPSRPLAKLELFLPEGKVIDNDEAQNIKHVVSNMAAYYALAPGEVMQPLQ